MVGHRLSRVDPGAGAAIILKIGFSRRRCPRAARRGAGRPGRYRPVRSSLPPPPGTAAPTNIRTMHLCEVAADLRDLGAEPGGHFLAKTFQGGHGRWPARHAETQFSPPSSTSSRPPRARNRSNSTSWQRDLRDAWEPTASRPLGTKSGLQQEEVGCPEADSNHRTQRIFKSAALPTELPGHVAAGAAFLRNKSPGGGWSTTGKAWVYIKRVSDLSSVSGAIFDGCRTSCRRSPGGADLRRAAFPAVKAEQCCPRPSLSRSGEKNPPTGAWRPAGLPYRDVMPPDSAR